MDWVTKGSTLFQWMPDKSLLSMGSLGRIKTDGLIRAR